MSAPDPAEVRRLHRAALTARLETLAAGREAARQGTRVDGDHRPASRGERGAVTAQAALQAGLAARLDEVRTALARLDALPTEPRFRVGAGAVVLLDDGDEERWYAVLPGAAGDVVETAAGPVLLVSPWSPVARALVGLEEGDEATLRRRGKPVEVEVLRVG